MFLIANPLTTTGILLHEIAYFTQTISLFISYCPFASTNKQMKPFFGGLCCVSRYFLIHSPLHAEVDHQPSSGLYHFSLRLKLISFPASLMPSAFSSLCCQINLGKEASSVLFSFSPVFRNSLLPFKIEWFSTCFQSRLILLRFSQSAQLTYPQASLFFPPPCSW